MLGAVNRGRLELAILATMKYLATYLMVGFFFIPIMSLSLAQGSDSVALYDGVTLGANYRYHSENGILYDTYYNERFGFSLPIPIELLSPEPAPANGDGRTFSNNNVLLRVFGSLVGVVDEGLGDSKAERLARTINALDVDITYQKVLKDGFAYSGYDPIGDIVYGLVLYDPACLKQASIIISYAPSVRHIFDDVVTEMVNEIEFSCMVPQWEGQ